MSFCPDCGTEVSEDTRFCPECGRPLATGQVVIGQAVKGKSKKKLVGIIATCIVAIIVIVVIATRPPTPVEPEPAIPAHFTTYTDELGLFSISYPPEWVPAPEYLEDIEQISKDIISSIESDLSVEEAHFLFMGGLPIIEEVYNPNFIIIVAPLPGITVTHDRLVTENIENIKGFWSDYHEFSRVKTTIDNRTATIIEYEVNMAGLGTFRNVLMLCIANKTVWSITCGTSPDEYSEWEDDFDAIVRSLRILK